MVDAGPIEEGETMSALSRRSFVGALAVGLTAGLPQEEALAFASHAAAITVSRMGAMPSIPTLEEVLSLMAARDYQGIDRSALRAQLS